MNKTMLALAAAALIPSVATAQSVAFSGAEIAYQFLSTDDDYDASGVTASAEANFLGQASAQLDLYGNEYDPGESYSGYTVHVGYAGLPGGNIGIFYGEEEWDTDGTWVHMGIEGAYTSGPVTLEASIGNNEQEDFQNYDIFRVDVSYAVTPEIILVGDFAGVSDDLDANIIGAGARYQMQNGFFVEGTAQSASGDVEMQTLGLEIGFAVNGGTTYGPRDWTRILPAF